MRQGLRWRHLSLRAKLALAGMAVQLAACAMLLWGSLGLLEHTLAQQAVTHTRQVVAMLEQTLAAPFAQRDYATLQQSLDLLRTDNALSYLVLRDHRARVVAASGWDAERALPPRDGPLPDLDRADPTWHLAADLSVSGQPLGRIELGLSTADARAARSEFIARSVTITLAALAVSMALLAAIAYAITRHLGRLARATRQVAEGRFDIAIPVHSDDEIGRLAGHFNAMAAALEQRVSALEDSERRQRAHLRAASEEQSRLATLLGAMDSGIVFIDAASRVIYANRAFAQIWSLPQPPAPGDAVQALLAAMARQLPPAELARVQVMAHPEGAPAHGHCELRTLDSRVIAQRALPVAADDAWIWFHADITAERHMQQRAQQALHDPLTRLLNRRGLYEALQDSLAAAHAERQPVALMFIDLDDFKHANDIGGHRLGDDILVAVALVLSVQLRHGGAVARLGGDEFAVVCPGLGSAEASVIAARLVQAVSELRFAAGEQPVRVGCSIGIAASPGDASGCDELVACADQAMYIAKQGGKNAWACFRDGEASRPQPEALSKPSAARPSRAPVVT